MVQFNIVLHGNLCETPADILAKPPKDTVCNWQMIQIKQ